MRWTRFIRSCLIKHVLLHPPTKQTEVNLIWTNEKMRTISAQKSQDFKVRAIRFQARCIVAGLSDDLLDHFNHQIHHSEINIGK